MEEEALWDILLDAGLTDEQIEEIMQLGALQGQQGLAQTQYERAQALRNAPGPRGRWTGRIYRHAHPLEHISHGIDRTMGAIEAEKQMKRQEQILAEQARLRGAMMRGMMQRQPQQQPPVGAMSPIQPGTGNPMTEALRRIDPYQLR